MMTRLKMIYCDDDDTTEDDILLFSVLRDDHLKVEQFWENTVPQYNRWAFPKGVSEGRFRRAFRVSRSIFDYLVEKLSPSLEDPPHFGGRPSVSPDKKIAMFMKYIGAKETGLDISQLFGVSESSLIKGRRQVADVIIDCLMDTVIQWPNAAECRDVAEEFRYKDVNNFPNVIGAIDGCHIPIATPRHNPNAYYNRKKFHSILLQAVCREDLRFTDICVGCPGRMHDARVLRNSDLWNSGLGKCLQGQYHILGDAAYPLSSWIMTPYRNTGHMTNEQKRYNTALSRRRQVIERAFGMLKRRFRRLNTGIDVVSMAETQKLTLAACVLHNIAILQNDIEDFEDDDNDDNRYSALVNNELRGQVNPVIQFPINVAVEGRLKRIAITNHL